MFLYDEPQSECYHCSQKEDILGEIKYWFEALMDQLNGNDEFNSEELYRYVQEIAASLGMRKKSLTTNPLLASWVEFNNTYLNNLTKKGS